MNADNARALVFGDTLACEETRSATFVPGALDANALRLACLRSDALLRAIAVVEDSRNEDGEERSTQELAMQRVEAKLDLLTALVATLVNSQEPHDPPQPIRWSALGVCLAVDTATASAAAPGTVGMFRVQPCDWLPEALQLPATVLASVADGDGHHLWLRFQSLPPALAAALERHLFRVHRRAIAESRRPR
jgi:hypothetical protein